MIPLIYLLSSPRKHEANMIEPLLHQLFIRIVIDPLNLTITPKQFNLNPILIYDLSATQFVYSTFVSISCRQSFLGSLGIDLLLAIEWYKLGRYFAEVAEGFLLGVEE